MWFPFLWLGLGFVLKWTREACENFRAWRRDLWARGVKKMEELGPTLFDVLLLVSSLLVLWMTFGYLHLGVWTGFLILLFWSFVLLIFKVK